MSNAPSIMELVKTLLDRGQEVAAAQALDRHLARRPDDAVAWRISGVLAARQNHFDDAVERIRRALALHAHPLWRTELLELLLGANRVDEAFALSRELIEETPAHPEALRASVTWLKAAARFDEAQQLLSAAVRSEPMRLEAWLALSELLRERGRVGEAVANYHEALARMPDATELWLGLAEAQEDGGDKSAAEKAYRTALRIDPSRGFTIGSLLELLGASADDALLERARSIMAGDRATDVARALVGYGLGKAEAARGKHEAAFSYWRQANEARRREIGVLDRAALRARVDALISVFDEAFFAERAGQGCDDRRPVFVVGMPRSGTTLTEQIIVSHPDAMGYGELPEISEISVQCARAAGTPWPAVARTLSAAQWQAYGEDYLRRLNARAEMRGARVVDKAPANFFYVGLIRALFPRAHIVWCRRDPRDICVSIYSENFGLTQPHATDLGDLGFYFREHERLMRHWQRVLPGQIHEASYEALIDAPDEKIRALIAALDLPWDEACMQFHAHERSVQTPSRWQVRKPLYKGSLGRWRHYEPWLQPLFDALSQPSA